MWRYRCGNRTFYITGRAKFLLLWFGEMAISDWLRWPSEPDRPMPWNARVRIETFPLVYFDWASGPKCILWPDGATENW